MLLRRARHTVSRKRISNIANTMNSKNATVAKLLNSGSIMMPAPRTQSDH